MTTKDTNGRPRANDTAFTAPDGISEEVSTGEHLDDKKQPIVDDHFSFSGQRIQDIPLAHAVADQFGLDLMSNDLNGRDKQLLEYIVTKACRDSKSVDANVVLGFVKKQLRSLNDRSWSGIGMLRNLYRQLRSLEW